MAFIEQRDVRPNLMTMGPYAIVNKVMDVFEILSTRVLSRFTLQFRWVLHFNRPWRRRRQLADLSQQWNQDAVTDQIIIGSSDEVLRA